MGTIGHVEASGQSVTLVKLADLEFDGTSPGLNSGPKAAVDDMCDLFGIYVGRERRVESYSIGGVVLQVVILVSTMTVV